MLAAVFVWWWLARARSDAANPSQASNEANASTRQSASNRPNRAKPPKLDLAIAAKASVSGTIRDPEGRPIEAAQVCTFSNRTARRGLEDRKLHCARSGPDGHYRIDDLLPVLTEVHASAPSYQPGQWQQYERGLQRNQVQLRAGQTSEGIDVILEPGGVLVSGVVRDIAGGEIEAAQVVVGGDWTSRSQARSVAISDEQGRFELWTAPGTIDVNTSADGYAMSSVYAIAPGQFIEVYMTPESVLVGKVVLASNGEPVEGAMVSAARSSTRTDANGRFRIDRLEPGIYKPSVEHDELYGQADEQVHLGLGETSDELVIRVHPAAYVRGKVVIAGSEQPCTLGWVSINNPGVHSGHASLDDEGHVEFRGVLAGEYDVHVNCHGYVAEDHYDKLVVGTEPLAPAVWQVREGLTIRGEVVDEAGQPLTNITVVARPVADPDAAREQVTQVSSISEPDGSFEIGGLLAGRYELGTSSWRDRPGPLEPLAVELQSGADLNDVRIVMPAFGTIRGRIVDETGKPVAGANLSASLVGGQGRQPSTLSNDAGEFTLDQLRPGQTRVSATGSGSVFGLALRKPGTSDDDIQGELIEVVANEVVELTLTVEAGDGRISGVVKDETGGVVADAFIDVERISEQAGANAAQTRRRVRWSWNTEPVLTDADGRFTIEGLVAGQYVVRANRKGGGEAVLEDVALGSHIELVIASTGELAGTVALPDGRAPERFTVSIEDKSSGFRQRDNYFRTDGVWRLREIPAGSYQLVASASEGSVTFEPAIELAEAELRDGITLVLEPRLTVKGRLVDIETGEPVAGIEVYAAGRSAIGRRMADERKHVSGPDGRFELSDVASGRLDLVAWTRAGSRKAKYSFFRQSMTLAAEPLVQDLGDLQLVPNRLEPNQDAGDLGFELNAYDPTIEPEEWEPIVALVRPGGPADGVGLAAGDVIEKIDGHDVLANGGRYHALTSVPAGTKLTLELRGGKTIELVTGAPIK